MQHRCIPQKPSVLESFRDATLREKIIKNVFRKKLYIDVYSSIAEKKIPLARSFAKSKIADEIRNSQILFIHIAKNAGTSINSILYGRQIGHFPASFYAISDPELFSVCTKFAILRDPCSRFASAARMFLNGGSQDVGISPAFDRDRSRLKTVGDIISWLEINHGNPHRVDMTFRSQSWFVKKDGQLIVDNLFDITNDDGTLSEFVYALTGRRMPHRNRAKGAAIELDDGQRDRIFQLYQEDYSLIKGAV